MKKLIIIPVYNEEKTIASVLTEIKTYQDYDIIAINDGSTDNSLKIIKEYKVKFINLKYNQGIGSAMKAGYLYASLNNYDITVQIDSDGQHDISKLNNLVDELITGNNDLVIGSRYMMKTDYKSKLFRRLGSEYFSTLLRLISGKTIRDPTSGFRAANKRSIQLFSKFYPYDYPEVPTLSYLLKNNYRVCEIPVNMKKRQGGKSSISAIDSFIYVIKVSIRCITNNIA
ncbi:MAG: glycosyl transferase family 2 [Herbinix sp.]|jgi:glycosyltransferase involved in cell wall biosynthesis|nr:glycosyl transferase family 2 [Herbinix sp.]